MVLSARKAVKCLLGYLTDRMQFLLLTMHFPKVFFVYVALKEMILFAFHTS